MADYILNYRNGRYAYLNSVTLLQRS